MEQSGQCIAVVSGKGGTGKTSFTAGVGAALALSGALLSQYQSFADINMGRGAIVIGLAAVIIGEVIFRRVRGNFAFTLATVAFGAIIYYLVLQVVLWLGLNANDLKLLSALVVAVFLAIPYIREKYFAKPVKPAKKGGEPRA